MRGDAAARPASRAEQAGRLLDLAQTAGNNRGDSRPPAAGFRRQRPGRRRHRPPGASCSTSSQGAGLPAERIALDLSICRGLDYYTGTIYETFLTKLPKIGSVCSGGRYDNLAGLYTKQQLPGVGASLGLDRLLAGMEELNLLQKTTTPAPVFIVQFQAERLGDYQRLARTLRAAGIGVGGLSRGEEDRPATAIRREARLPPGPDRRRRRIRQAGVENQGPGQTRGEDGA